MRKKVFVVGALLCTLMLSGCGNDLSSDDSISKPAQESVVKTTEKKTEKKTEKTTEAAVQLLKPSGIKYTYNADTSELSVTWNEVSGATGYEIKLGNASQEFQIPSCVVTNVQEGTSGTLMVRAIHKGKTRTDYSEYAEAKYEIAVKVDKPQNVKSMLDGRIVRFKWDEAKGATGYQVEYNGKVTDLENPSCKVTDPAEGTNVAIKFRTVKTVNSKAYYSDWVDTTFAMPVIELEKYSNATATLLCKDDLIAYAKLNGFKYKETQEGDATIVDVYYKDAINGGILKTLLRTGKDALGAYLSNYLGTASSTIINDLNNTQNIVVGILEEGGLKEYANSYIHNLDEEADSNGKMSALEKGLSTLFMDTNIHNYYYYKDTAKGAICSTNVMMVDGREDYIEKNYGKFSTDKDGKYPLMLTRTNQGFTVQIKVFEMKGYKYFYIITSKDDIDRY
ncbi:hypothetical protein SAMN04487934_10954 [Eubacterium ruminantium]|nr:hypothetical protein SAMN04487934_10954 [Eubacterium ruminantium]